MAGIDCNHEPHHGLRRLAQRQRGLVRLIDKNQQAIVGTDSGEFSAAEIGAGAAEASGLGLLIRSVVGTDLAAASETMSAFVGDTTLTATSSRS